MNRKSSLYPGVNGTGVGGPPLPGPTLRFQPQAFYNPPPQRDRPWGSSRKSFRHPTPLLPRSRLPRGTANSCGSLKIAS